MEVLDQAPDVIGVRMGVQEAIDEQPPLIVPIELVPDLFPDVGGVVVLVVGRLPDVDVGQDPTTGLGLEQHHVAVVDFEK